MNRVHVVNNRIGDRGFRPQQGLLIMNFNEAVELMKNGKIGKFPSPTGDTYYEYTKLISVRVNKKLFPSPTGVTYYEFLRLKRVYRFVNIDSFRPQQGLLIMNYYVCEDCGGLIPNGVSVPNRGYLL